jgi:hypothetical protein
LYVQVLLQRLLVCLRHCWYYLALRHAAGSAGSTWDHASMK